VDSPFRIGVKLLGGGKTRSEMRLECRVFPPWGGMLRQSLLYLYRQTGISTGTVPVLYRREEIPASSIGTFPEQEGVRRTGTSCAYLFLVNYDELRGTENGGNEMIIRQSKWTFGTAMPLLLGKQAPTSRRTMLFALMLKRKCADQLWFYRNQDKFVKIQSMAFAFSTLLTANVARHARLYC
jgi:hypothetical protein